MEAKNPHVGHRDRLRDQILERGTAGLPEHNLLEFLLFYCIPRKDTNALAHRLIDKFGSLSGVLDASPDELLHTEGIGRGSAALLSSLTGVWRAYQANKLESGTVLDSSEKIGAYLHAMFDGRAVETLCLICLDLKYKVLSCRVIATGSVDRVAFPVRTIIETALAQNAASIIIGHNHPSGFALPTKNDEHSTMMLVQALKPLHIELFDHCIVCEDDFVSMRDSGWFKRVFAMM